MSKHDYAITPGHAESIAADHQPWPGTTTCQVCGTRHPCDVYDLATDYLAALAELDAGRVADAR